MTGQTLPFLVLVLVLLFVETIVLGGSEESEDLDTALVFSRGNRLEVVKGSSGGSDVVVELNSSVVAVTSVGGMVFASDLSGHVYSVNIDVEGGNAKVVKIVEEEDDDKGVEMAESLTYDPSARRLYLADSKTAVIFAADLDRDVGGKVDLKVIASFENGDRPKSVAFDSCSGHLYWTVWSRTLPRLERCHSDGSNRSTVILSGILRRPRGLHIDNRNRLYFADDDDQGGFTINRVWAVKNKSAVVCRGRSGAPFAVTSNEKELYWSDGGNLVIWRADKQETCNMEAALRLQGSDRPMGLTVISPRISAVNCGTPDALTDHKEPEKESLVVQTHAPYCQNFCLHGGVCSAGPRLRPVCQCPDGFSGDRCENLACNDNFCLNGGSCNMERGKPKCTCQEEFQGRRCQDIVIRASTLPEVNRSNPSRWSGWKTSLAISIFFILVCASSGVCFILIRIRRRLSSNPPPVVVIQAGQHVRTFSASKPVFEENKKNQTAVDLEDCCQMTLCDTPCSRATFHKPSVAQGGRGFCSHTKSYPSTDKACLLSVEEY